MAIVRHFSFYATGTKILTKALNSLQYIWSKQKFINTSSILEIHENRWISTLSLSLFLPLSIYIYIHTSTHTHTHSHTHTYIYIYIYIYRRHLHNKWWFSETCGQVHRPRKQRLIYGKWWHQYAITDGYRSYESQIYAMK